MIQLSILNDPKKQRLLIESDFPMRDRELIKALPGSKYSTKTHQWTAPLTWASLQAMRGMFGEHLVVCEDVEAWSWNHWNTTVGPALEARNAWDSENLTDTFPDLYPFQRGGVDFLSSARGAMLMDEMGTGKTPQTIRTLWNLVLAGENPFPAIVIAPNNMTLTWKKEFERFFPGVNVEVIKGGAAQKQKIMRKQGVHVFVINFEAVRIHSRLSPYGGMSLRRCVKCDPTLLDAKLFSPARCEVHPKELNAISFKTIIVDEAHRMKNPKAKQTRATVALRTPETKFVFGLTGTAIADSPVDLWPILNLIDPEQFPSRASYIDRYCLTSFDMFGTMSIVGLNPINRDEFFRVVDPITRRMPKAAVLPFLPSKVYSTRYEEMTPKQARAYREMDENQIAILGSDYSGVTVSANPLTELTRLTQFSSSFAELDAEGNVKLTMPSNKITALLEIMEDLGEDEPVVVFAQSRQLIELASKALTNRTVNGAKKPIKHSMIVGGQSPDERELAKEDFQNGKVRAILCTIAAGGIGITLTRSKTAIFLQRSWSMIENKQAEDRVHRIGSEIHESIQIIDIVSPGTIEEQQRVALAGKEDRLQEIMRDADIVARVKAEERNEMEEH